MGRDEGSAYPTHHGSAAAGCCRLALADQTTGSTSADDRLRLVQPLGMDPFGTGGSDARPEVAGAIRLSYTGVVSLK